MRHFVGLGLGILAFASSVHAQDPQRDDALHALFDETWAFRLQEDPLRATSVGDHASDDRLPRVALADQKRRAEYYRGVMTRLEALTLHEAVPGHHLQNALRQELVGLPEFRRYSGIGAYGEGWGLYSERLGLEAGFYEDPYSNFGRLTYEMWRACRLVVDTGLHAKGWTRQQAIDYLGARTALSLHEITTETDRYISWPGQALGYKMGELKIRELRARAQDALGAGFDVREFHDVILGSGPLPLPVLDELVGAWIESLSR